MNEQEPSTFVESCIEKPPEAKNTRDKNTVIVHVQDSRVSSNPSTPAKGGMKKTPPRKDQKLTWLDDPVVKREMAETKIVPQEDSSTFSFFRELAQERYKNSKRLATSGYISGAVFALVGTCLAIAKKNTAYPIVFIISAGCILAGLCAQYFASKDLRHLKWFTANDPAALAGDSATISREIELGTPAVTPKTGAIAPINLTSST